VANRVAGRSAVRVLVRVALALAVLQIDDFSGRHVHQLGAVGVGHRNLLPEDVRPRDGGLTLVQTDPHARRPTIGVRRSRRSVLRLDRDGTVAAVHQIGERLPELREHTIRADVHLLRVTRAGLCVVSERVALVSNHLLEPSHLVDGALDVRGVLGRVYDLDPSRRRDGRSRLDAAGVDLADGRRQVLAATGREAHGTKDGDKKGDDGRGELVVHDYGLLVAAVGRIRLECGERVDTRRLDDVVPTWLDVLDGFLDLTAVHVPLAPDAVGARTEPDHQQQNPSPQDVRPATPIENPASGGAVIQRNQNGPADQECDDDPNQECHCLTPPPWRLPLRAETGGWLNGLRRGVHRSGTLLIHSGLTRPRPECSDKVGGLTAKAVLP